jgi:site-specific recombinase XerD
MEIPANQDRISERFLEHLTKRGVTANTLKFYKSDLSHFAGWLIFKARTFGASVNSLSEVLPFINTKTAHEYKNYLLKNKIAKSTVNRRLSTLRNFASFLVETQILSFNFAKDLKNLTSPRPKINPALILFAKHLEEQKTAPNTIKNYLADVRQFINWMNQN